MKFRELTVGGAFEIVPRQFPDGRGVFLESFRADLLAEHTGHRLDTVQTNVSVSGRGALRGIHYADLPPSQAKYVTALSGSFLDFVVDLRTGSPTFGRWDAVNLDLADRRAVFVPEGMGHALLALEDGATAFYLCSASYDPGREHGVHPLDPQIGLSIPPGVVTNLSAKDAAAPTLAQALTQGLLPSYDDARRWYARSGCITDAGGDSPR